MGTGVSGGGRDVPCFFSSTLLGHGQLGSCRHRPARGGARSHSLRQCGHRSFVGGRAANNRRHGGARARIPGRHGSIQLRCPRLLAWRDDRAIDGAGSSLDLPKDHSRRHRSPRRRRHHAPREAQLSPAFGDPNLKGYAILQKIFFTPSQASQAAGEAFIGRLMLRKEDREPTSGPKIAEAQLAAFREWEQFSGKRFADLKSIRQPTLVVNGVFDEMIPVSNSYSLGENLPNAVLLTYPDAGHGSLFQYPSPSRGRRKHSFPPTHSSPPTRP